MTLDRRQFVSFTAAGALLGTALPAFAAKKKTPPRLPKPTAPGKHAVRDLPFDPKKLTGLSEALLVSHHDNNYAGAVKNLNKVELELAQVTKDTPGFEVAALRERELLFTNSMILHEHYFANLGGDGKVGGDIEALITGTWSTVGGWEEQFRATAMGLGGGSGWVTLDLNFQSGDLRIHSSQHHTQAVAFGQPLLVLDMYEHSYAIDYGAGHAKYIDAFFQNIAWDEVNARLGRTRGAYAALHA
ncbi:MAG TPA: Fe-Mn family superoxide dismutase [Kofleriaceae bacterium]|nr:Fe-Mn family superoxide dismutase [Kofleriaceae bacterium]